MARARNIKPAFFMNEVLVGLAFEYRLLFIGIWTLADREGRLEDRPVRIKMEVFPADNVDVEAGLQALHDSGFIQRYEVEGSRYIQVKTWAKHQNPHHREVASTIPAPAQPRAKGACMGGEPRASLGPGPENTGSASKSTGSAVLIPDSGYLIQESLERQAARSSGRFAEFWQAYPNKKGKAVAEKAWKRKRLDAIADRIIADVKARAAGDRQWLDGFIPHGSTYVNGEGWQDAIEPPRDNSGGADGRDDFMARAV